MNQGQLFIFENEVKTALFINSLSKPQCYQIGDIIIFLNDRSEVLDKELLQKATRDGFANYNAYCAKKGQQASKNRNVFTLVAEGSIPDDFNLNSASNILMSGKITTTGNPYDGILEIRSKKLLVIENKNSAGDNIQNKVEDERKMNLANRKIKVDAIRARFGLQFERSKNSSIRGGFLDGIFSSDTAKLSGAWSSIKDQSNHDVLMLTDKHGSGVVEWCVM